MSLLAPDERDHLLRVLRHAQPPLSVTVRHHAQQVTSLLVSADPAHRRDDLCSTELAFTDDPEELNLMQDEVRHLIEQHPSQYNGNSMKLIYTAGFQLDSLYPATGLRVLRITRGEFQFVHVNPVQDNTQRSRLLDVRCASAISMDKAIEALTARRWHGPIQNAPALAHDLFTDLLAAPGTAHLCEATWATPHGDIDLPALAYLHPLHTHGHVISQDGETCLLTALPLNGSAKTDWSNQTHRLQQATILETLTLPVIEVTDNPTTVERLKTATS